MPNRTDHTVKKTRSDRDLSINPFVMVTGSAIAGFGALTVMLSGGLIGIWLGAAILTTLIVLQVISLLKGLEREQGGEDDQSERPVASGLDQNEPILILGVSELGRVRSLFGRIDLLPGAKIGRVLEDVLPKAALEAGTYSSPSAGELAVLRLRSNGGSLIILLPAGLLTSSAEAEVQERTRFFASLGHDLKSPLNGIIGFADIMDAELRGPIPEGYKDYPALIKESGETLLRLVDDLLGYAKAEAGTYELDIAPLDIAASAESVFRQSKGIAELSGVELVLQAEEEVMMLADAGAVRRIWDNLVSNAIKYSSRGDTVTMRAFADEKSCYLSVKDTGAGMAAADLARIAKPFAQGENAKGRAGTGLGLAMVQRLAELQNGKVKIETSLGAGTHVLVSFPAFSSNQKRAAE